ncbi:HNH endonuclease [Acinetobacter sp. 1000160]|uniref:HNH endonuclease n=1 Tax=Acinetobacter sp. 1000160 TaxID=1310800 RepID=UPI00044D6045|nr:hypothetical protein [Acinetobacter sp. 1000160]EXB47945.1 HNH endonuclease family protein [Acinetobacter baumannii 146457]EYT20051.1 HNH endonuclease family protein [Acinetobacter sp. 1000160]
MINLTPPDFSFIEILKACQDNDNRVHENTFIIPRVNKKIQELGKLYDKYAQENNLNSCELAHFHLDEDIDYLQRLYTYRLQKKEEGRVYYEKIIDDISEFCPYCNHGAISQVDHFLPKSLYDSFTIYPNNLVPICAVCNGVKDDYYGLELTNNLLHPYFDDLNHSQWLFSNLRPNPQRRLIVEYICQPNPQFYNPNEIARLINNFNKLKLNNRFKAIARSQSRQIKSNLTKVISFNSNSVKKRYIKRVINKGISDHGPNHWNVALYQAFYSYTGDLQDFI